MVPSDNLTTVNMARNALSTNLLEESTEGIR